jgi:hypothetical protein
MVRIGANRDTVALFFAADFLLAFTVFFTDRFLGARNTGNRVPLDFGFSEGSGAFWFWPYYKLSTALFHPDSTQTSARFDIESTQPKEKLGKPPK